MCKKNEWTKYDTYFLPYIKPKIVNKSETVMGVSQYDIQYVGRYF